MSGFMNGCELKSTLNMFNKFKDIYHCHTFGMYKEEDCEVVYICFDLYGKEYNSKWTSNEPDSIEVFLEALDGEWFSVGNTTPEKLYNFLKPIPHIYDILED